MSFRIKTTHTLLQPYVPPPAPKKKEDGKTSSVASQSVPKKLAPAVAVSKPKDGSSQGMAIRTVPTAQADHM